MTNIRRALATLGLGAGMVVANAFGGTITQTFTLPTTAITVTDAQSNSAFEYFGQYGLAGQTLNSVTIQFDASEALQSLTITNTTGAPQLYNESITGTVLVDSIANENANGAGSLSDTDALNYLSNSGNGDTGNVWNIGNAACYMNIGTGVTQSWWAAGAANPSAPSRTNAGNTSPTGNGSTCTPAEGSGTLTIAPAIYNVLAQDLADYNASGFFNLSFQALTGGNYSNSNINAGVSSATNALGTFQIIYNYGPSGAPEPTTMLLFGSSLVGLGLLRRRVAKR